MIEILSSAALSTVQDQGRDGYLRYGVGTSGAMDRIALTVANLLLGNSSDAAAIEIPIFPFRVRFLEDTAFALTGADCLATLDERSILPWWTVQAKKGQVLRLGSPAVGARCYLALAGGVDTPMVLGSRSTQLRGEFGGFQGRNLRKGDVIGAIGPHAAQAKLSDAGMPEFGVEPPNFFLTSPSPVPPGDAEATVVRVLPAGEYDCYEAASLEAFWREDWKVTPDSDRYGYRLAGPTLNSRSAIEKRSHGIVPGVIQVPHRGQPIIQLRDAQPSGGYPKIGTVIEADLWRIGQTRIGSRLRFVKTSYEDALSALAENERYLDKVANLVALYRSSLLTT